LKRRMGITELVRVEKRVISTEKDEQVGYRMFKQSEKKGRDTGSNLRERVKGGES